MAKRAAFLFLFAVGVAAHGGGWFPWLLSHTDQIVQVAEECSAAKHAIHEAHALTTPCSSTKGVYAQAAWASWLGLNALKNVEFAGIGDKIKNANVTKLLETVTEKGLTTLYHDALGEFCTNPHCAAASQKLWQKLQPCYSTVYCMSLQPQFNLQGCEVAMSAFMTRMGELEIGSTCVLEGTARSGGPYCWEVFVNSFVRAPECAFQFTQPTDCSDECIAQWLEIKAQHGFCSSFYSRWKYAMQEATLDFVRALLKSSIDPELQKAVKNVPARFPMMDESCSNSTKPVFDLVV